MRQQAIQSGAKAVNEAIVGVWHYRYATSSPPAILETHWHEWMPARTANVWRVEDGKWLCARQTVNHRITHNGDFDAWMLFGEPVENADLGLWRDLILALCQHRSIARWTVSERAAFVTIAVHVFFHNNIYQATKVFMSRAIGSFGLVTASTLSEASLLSAWRQPMATGFNVCDDYMVYASEPAAVDAVLADIPRSYRLDLVNRVIVRSSQTPSPPLPWSKRCLGDDINFR